MHVKKSRAEEKCYKIESYAVRKEKNQKYERKQFKHDTHREMQKKVEELRSERKLCEQLSHAHLTYLF